MCQGGRTAPLAAGSELSEGLGGWLGRNSFQNCPNGVEQENGCKKKPEYAVKFGHCIADGFAGGPLIDTAEQIHGRFGPEKAPPAIRGQGDGQCEGNGCGDSVHGTA